MTRFEVGTLMRRPSASRPDLMAMASSRALMLLFLDHHVVARLGIEAVVVAVARVGGGDPVEEHVLRQHGVELPEGARP